MMSKRTKAIMAMFIVVSFITGSLLGNVVFAASSLIKLSEAFLNNDIKVVINKAVFQAKDPQDGSIYVPISYKGRTYLPLRAVAEAVGLPVQYVDATKTAYLGKMPDNINTAVQDVFINATPEYADANAAGHFMTKKIDAARLTTSTGKIFEYGYCGVNDFFKPTFKCEFKYKKLQFTVYSAYNKKQLDRLNGGDPKPLKIKITNELGVVIKEVDVKHGTETVFDIDCIDYASLQVYVAGGSTIVGEPKFVK